MKIHLKDNKIALYDIESDYRQYLFQYDFRVNLKSGRRFVGIIVGIEDYTYFYIINFKAFKKKWKKKKSENNSKKFTTKVTKSLLHCLLIT